jgi:hypothetical protein
MPDAHLLARLDPRGRATHFLGRKRRRQPGQGRIWKLGQFPDGRSGLLDGPAAPQIRDEGLNPAAGLCGHFADQLIRPCSQGLRSGAKVPCQLLGLFPGTHGSNSLLGRFLGILGAPGFEGMQPVKQGGDSCGGVPDKLPRALDNRGRDAKAAGNINGEAATREPDM